MNQKSRRTFIKLAASGTALACTPLMLRGAPTRTGLPTSKVKKFLAACESGAIEIVKQLLDKQASLIGAKDKQGRTGFALALLAGHKEVGEFLKTSGYQRDLHETVLDLDWKHFDELVGEESVDTITKINADHPIGGNTMWAAAAGGPGADIWRVYAKCGDPNANARKEAGSTPLQKALRYPDLAIAEMTSASLLSNDTHPNTPLNADLPPLHIAAERGSFTLVEMLIRLGAEVDQKDQQGRHAVQVAAHFGHQSVFELLTHHQQIPRTCRTSRMAYDKDGRPYQAPDISDIPWHLRGRLVGNAHGNLEYVQKVVTADPRMAHSIATTSEICVEACAHIGRKNIVDYLLQQGAPYSLPTAVMLGDYTSVKRLLDEDPKRIEERGAHDFGLLWYPVIGKCELDMTQLLLDRGAKIEQQHFLGTTALHWACIRGPIELVELLVENGADVNRIGRKFKAEGETPLQSTKDEKIANYLRSKGAK